MEDVLLIVRDGADKWTVDHNLEGTALQSVAVDPQHSVRIYVGTDDQGVWRSQDGGRTWGPAGSGIAWTDVTAIAVGGERAGRLDTVYVGTEPSAVFRSTDGGETWKELKRASPNFRLRPPGASRPGPRPPRTLDWNRPARCAPSLRGHRGRRPRPISGRWVVFTGRFEFGTRERCEQTAVSRGGRIPDSNWVTHRLDYLVVGTHRSRNRSHRDYGSKIEAAVVERETHGTPAIITEAYRRSFL